MSKFYRTDSTGTEYYSGSVVKALERSDLGREDILLLIRNKEYPANTLLKFYRYFTKVRTEGTKANRRFKELFPELFDSQGNLTPKGERLTPTEKTMDNQRTMSYTFNLGNRNAMNPIEVVENGKDFDVCLYDISGEQYAYVSHTLQAKAYSLGEGIPGTPDFNTGLFYIGAHIRDREPFMNYLRNLKDLPWPKDGKVKVTVDCVRL